MLTLLRSHNAPNDRLRAHAITVLELALLIALLLTGY
jgi:hypothetical protein